MTQNNRRRGFLASAEGIKKLEEKIYQKDFTNERLAEAAGLTTDDQVKKLRNPQWKKGIQKDAIEKIAKVLDLDPAEIVGEEWYPPVPSGETTNSAVDIDWREVCGAMLKDQHRKQQLRRQATEMGFETDFPPVTLGLVKREKQQRRGGDVDREQMYGLDKDAIAKTYQHDEFLQEAIANSQASENKNIAIIGEPGAGKTTYLQKIVSFIESDTQDFPICIPLASLQGRTLQDYLLKTWLPEALALVNPEMDNVETLYKASLQKRFRQGGVWLLLDGVDEMGLDSPAQTLATIQQQLTDWVAQARIVLTCRLNIWDASINNTLTNFDTYRTQQFQPEQIDDFIQQWFTCAGNLQRGEQLQAKLKESGRERIRELVKHPLRLVLLCQVFYRNEQAELPETKAGLYQLFTRYFYEWKQNIHPVDNSTQAELNQALGKLALAGINSTARFRLKESLAREEMGEGMFKLACDIGWLNLVDRDAETDEAVYAFFHPTFQEYFAALAIEDWDYFLPKKHDNQNAQPAGYNYRVFESSWREVILLWMGRNSVEKEHKEDFINALTLFEDGCTNFYALQAFCLAAIFIAEFKDCSNAEWIVSVVAEWSSECNPIIGGDSFGEMAKTTLLETEHSNAINVLIDLFNASEDKNARLSFLDSLGKVGVNSPRAINALTKVVDTSCNVIRLYKQSLKELRGNKFTKSHLDLWGRIRQEGLICWQAAMSLANITSEKQAAVNGLINLLNFDCDLRASGIWIIGDLSEIAANSSEAIEQVVKIIGQRLDCSQHDLTVFIDYCNMLAEIGTNNLEAIQILSNILKTDNEAILYRTACTLKNINPGNSEALKMLEYLSQNAKNVNIASSSINTLQEMTIDQIKTLDDLLPWLQPEKICQITVKKLEEIGADSPEAIKALIQVLNDPSQDKKIRFNVASILLNQSLKTAEIIDLIIELLRGIEDRRMLDKYLKLLLEIDPNNPKVIDLIVNLLDNSDDMDKTVQAAYQWGRIGVYQSDIAQCLTKLIETEHKPNISWKIAESLGQTVHNNRKAINALMNILINSDGSEDYFPFSLKNVSSEIMQEVVFKLKSYSNKRNCDAVLWYCAQNMNYPDFYQAWHGHHLLVEAKETDKTSVSGIQTIESLQSQFTDFNTLLKQLQSTEKTYLIPVSVSRLETETDKSAIAQALCNRIYEVAFPDNANKIPEVNNAFQLERSLLQLRQELQKQHLALILYNCEPHPALIDFCNQLTDVLHIAWVTNEPLEPPLKGILPDFSILISALQSWIDELG